MTNKRTHRVGRTKVTMIQEYTRYIISSKLHTWLPDFTLYHIPKHLCIEMFIVVHFQIWMYLYNSISKDIHYIFSDSEYQ